MFFTKIKTADINDIKTKNMNRNNIIDVRTSSEHKMNSISGTKNIELNKLLLDPDKYLKKDLEYFVYCQSGMRAKKATKALTKKGFNVTCLGGIMSYRG